LLFINFWLMTQFDAFEQHRIIAAQMIHRLLFDSYCDLVPMWLIKPRFCLSGLRNIYNYL